MIDLNTPNFVKHTLNVLSLSWSYSFGLSFIWFIATISDYSLLVVSEAVAEAEDQEEDVVDEMSVVEEGGEGSGGSEIGITRMGGAEDY